ncbi:tudor domain-containing protein 7-like isoform X2 [Ornithodoros turicata]|uniref:tudor domain-containing protein 7-like isoform X2 n=1 Tax=Ornithodoros turicata TaxID=34597 RepID=UPI0031386350
MASTLREEVATMLRSVLSSEKNGVPVVSLEKEYRLLIGHRIPYRNLGFNSLQSFLESLPDVVRLCRGPTGDMIAKAVVTESTLHVAQMVAGQKSTKSKPIMRSTYRHPTSKRRPGYRPINFGHRAYKYEEPLESYSSRSSGSRGVHQPRRSSFARQDSPVVNKPAESSATVRRSSFEVPPRFRKSLHDDRSSPDWTTKGSTAGRDAGRRPSPKVASEDAEWGTDQDDTWGALKEDGDANGWGSSNSEGGENRTATNDVSHWAGWDSEKPPCDIRPTVTSSGGRDGGVEKVISIEPSQPRFDPFREGIRLPKKLQKTSSESQHVSPRVLSEPPIETDVTSPCDIASTPVQTKDSAPCDIVSTPAQTQGTAPAVVSDCPFMQLVANHAYRHGLTAVYTTCSSRSCKRGPLVWLATLKLDGRTYNSYPNERETEVAAKEEAAKKAVVTLRLSKGTDTAFPVTAAGTAQEILALEKRIAELVAAKPCGLLNTSVPDLYKERFCESLPENWLDHMVVSSHVSLSGVDGNRCILYARGTLPPRNGQTPAEAEGSQVDDYIDVFITCVTGTDNVCFRFIEYADEYDELMEKMNCLYSSGNRRPAQNVAEEELYAICAGGEWLRVQTVCPVKNGQVQVTFVDRGDTVTVKAADLYNLEPEFAVFPLQAIRCQLGGLVEYSLCDNASDILVEMLLGKTLVAEIVQKEEPVIVVLYDTWSDEDLNLNLEMAIRLAEPRLPGCIGRAQLTHVDTSGDIYLQVLGPGLESLVHAMDIINLCYENNNDLVTTLVAGKLYACRFGNDRTFYRATLLSSEPELSGKFPVQYVDFGNKDSTFVADLRELDVFGSFVVRLPHQAVRCRLDGLPEDQPWTELCTNKLWEAVVGSTELLVKVMRPASGKEPASVALFRRMESNKELVSINVALHTSSREDS